MMKRIIAMLLTVAMLVSAVPVGALAAETASEQTAVDTGDVSIEGTNGFGTLLSQEITESQEETAEESEDYQVGYTVTDLTIEGTTATVTYDSLEEALLVVALYTEDGMRMVTSATATVTADATEAMVEFTGEMPEYFLASAYLVDTYDLSPLCAAYDTPMYTQEMQELLASTVEDYDADRVLNLDDDNTTNFAVYADTTKVIEAVEGANTVASIDDENATYIIENADEQITSLAVGDVFVYPYAENEFLIAKVGTIKIVGTTATITGDDLEMEEAFSHVKIADNGATSDFVVDESTPVDGVTYEGMFSEQGDAGLMSDDISDTYEKYFKYSIDQPLDQTQPGLVEGELKIVGSLEFTVAISVEYYQTESKRFLEVRIENSITTELKIDAEIKLQIPLLPAKYRNLGLAIGFEPEFQVEVSGKISFSASVETAFVILYSTEKGLSVSATGACPSKELSVECEFFFGIDLNPVIEIAEGWVVEFDAEIPVGFKFEGKFNGTDFVYEGTNVETIHGCETCLGVDVYFVAEVKPKVKFLKCKWLTFETGESFSWYLFSFYYSFTNQVIGLGDCPYRTYRVTFQVKDSTGTPVKGAEIFTADGISLGTTNSSGTLIAYLKEATYQVHTIISGAKVTQGFEVDGACKVTLSPDTGDGSFGGILGDVDSDSIEDGSYIIASGTCGTDGDNITWELTASGVLTLSGRGMMEDFGEYISHGYVITRNWGDEEKVKEIVIEDGITNIGSAAFYGCTNLHGVTIPDSVTIIGEHAFSDCSSLTDVILPKGLTKIQENTFEDCTALRSVTIPESVTQIRDYAFSNCESLRSITIPNSVDYLGWYTFYECSNLSNVTLPDGITSISNGLFAYCDNLNSITIPTSVTSIGDDAFKFCNNLSGIAIPSNVISIGEDAFFGCTNLHSVMIPVKVESIGVGAFASCTNLTDICVDEENTYFFSNAFGVLYNKQQTKLIQVPGATSGHFTIPDTVLQIGDSALQTCVNLSSITIPDSVTSIGDFAFSDCDNISSIAIPDSVISLGDYAFKGCDKLSNLTLGNGMTSIGYYTFSNCNSLSNVTIPDSVTYIDDYAFYWCINLRNISIGQSVTNIGYSAFNWCSHLCSVTIPVSVTSIGDSAFFWCDELSDIYYGGTEEQWAQISIGSHNETLINTTIHYNSIEPVEWLQIGVEVPLSSVNADTQEPDLTPDAIYPGDYSTEVTDTYTLKTASFTGLVPSEQYILLAMKSIEAEDPLAADNLLFIDQGVALEDGTLVFQYVQRETADISYVVACGASSKNLNDAEITFQEMLADGELQVVDPTVVYDGVTLTEGWDYVIVGTVDFAEEGTYTCYIRGIHNYTGLVECAYTVGGTQEYTVTYTSASVSLAGDIGVNYYAQLSDDVVADESAYMQFTVAGQTQIAPLSEAVVSTDANGVTTYRFSCKVAAKQMTEEITGQMYLSDGTAVGEAKVYSVKAYCDAAIPVYSQYEAYTDLVDLMEAMLNYGGYSQTQFGYNTDNLANAGLDTALPTITADDVAAYAHGATGSEEGISVASVSLLLESTTTIRFYFNLDGTKSIDEYTFYVDGVETTPVAAENGQYYVDKVNVAAKDLDEMVTVTIGGLTVKYCGLSYVRQVAVLYPNYYSEALVNVAKALYAYNQAANAYFG